MLGLSTLLSTAIAATFALLLGALLARLASYWFSGQGVTHLLVQARGLVLPIFGAPLLARGLDIHITVAIGLTVGASQSIMVARWGARPSGGFGSTLLGTTALGRSGAAWLAQKTLSRGAIVACLGATWIEVVSLEAMLTCFKMPGLIPFRSVGAELVLGSAATTPFLIVAGTCAIFLTETSMSALLQRRARRAVPST